MSVFTDPSLEGSSGQCASQPGAVCPLSSIGAGRSVRIRGLEAAPEVTQRLREIGFVENQVIRLVTSRANFICQICNARLALSPQLARAILVEPVPASAAA